MTDKEKLTDFIKQASNAAYEYDNEFLEPRWEKDNHGIYAISWLVDLELDSDYIKEEQKRVNNKETEWPKIRVTNNLTIPTMTLQEVVTIEWGSERPIPSVCSNPQDLMAIFYA